jgi:hypothetical protein
LHRIEFYSLVPNDENRGADGNQLRETFLDEGGAITALPFLSCTMLEMLIGLSQRLEFETAQSRWEKTPREWFWVLIDNLDLDFRTLEGLSLGDYVTKIEDSVTLLLERGFDFDGNGGLFPLKHAKNDQRRVEIWYQMSAYMLENYPI